MRVLGPLLLACGASIAQTTVSIPGTFHCAAGGYWKEVKDVDECVDLFLSHVPMQCERSKVTSKIFWIQPKDAKESKLLVTWSCSAADERTSEIGSSEGPPVCQGGLPPVMYRDGVWSCPVTAQPR
jgi:hypothetical protein